MGRATHPARDAGKRNSQMRKYQQRAVSKCGVTAKTAGEKWRTTDSAEQQAARSCASRCAAPPFGRSPDDAQPAQSRPDPIGGRMRGDDAWWSPRPGRKGGPAAEFPSAGTHPPIPTVPRAVPLPAPCSPPSSAPGGNWTRAMFPAQWLRTTRREDRIVRSVETSDSQFGKPGKLGELECAVTAHPSVCLDRIVRKSGRQDRFDRLFGLASETAKETVPDQ